MRTSMSRGIIGWMLLLALAIVLLLLLRNRQDAGDATEATDHVPNLHIYIGAGLLALAIGAIAVGLWLIRKATWLMQPVARYQFSEESLRIETPCHTRTRPWQALHSFADTPRVLVVRRSPMLADVIPKRSFASVAELAAAQELLVRKLSVKAERHDG